MTASQNEVMEGLQNMSVVECSEEDADVAADDSVTESEMPALEEPGSEWEGGSDSDEGGERQDKSSPKPAPRGPDYLFGSPACGNSGPKRDQIVEMCVALMQHLHNTHPEIMKCLVL